MSCPDLIQLKADCVGGEKASFNCPVDIYVYDSNKKLCAAIVNDKPQYIEGSSVSSFIDSDGQKVFYLPSDQNYSFVVKGTDTGEMTCSFSGVDILTNSKSNIENYYELPVSRNKEYNVALTQSEDNPGSLSVTLSENNKQIQPSEILDDDSLKYTATLTQSGDTGLIIGGGKYIKGEYKKLTAYETEENSFDGWYDSDGTLLSTDTTYRFMVSEDKNITGKFSSKESEIVLGDVNLDGSINVADVRLALRRAIGLENYAAGTIQFLACDVNFDCDVKVDDARLILRAAISLDDPKQWIKK